MKPPLLFVLGAAMFISACSGMLTGKKAAEESVADFHKLYNSGKLTAIYSAGDAKFQSATPEKDFLEFMGAVQRKLGHVTQTTEAGFNVRTFNLTTTIVLNQNTTFEHGMATEVFTFGINDGKAKLVGYNINSNDLILK